MDYLDWMVGINEATGIDIPQRVGLQVSHHRLCRDLPRRARRGAGRVAGSDRCRSASRSPTLDCCALMCHSARARGRWASEGRRSEAQPSHRRMIVALDSRVPCSIGFSGGCSSRARHRSTRFDRCGGRRPAGQIGPNRFPRPRGTNAPPGDSSSSSSTSSRSCSGSPAALAFVGGMPAARRRDRRRHPRQRRLQLHPGVPRRAGSRALAALLPRRRRRRGGTEANGAGCRAGPGESSCSSEGDRISADAGSSARRAEGGHVHADGRVEPMPGSRSGRGGPRTARGPERVFAGTFVTSGSAGGRRRDRGRDPAGWHLAG